MPVTGFHKIVFFIIMMAYFCEQMDNWNFGFIAPALKCIGFYGTYTYTHTQVNNFNFEGRENEKDLSLPGSPEHTANASLYFEKKGFNVRFSYNYASSFIDEMGEVAALDRYYDAVTVGIDFTARDLQRKFREAGNPWELCKGFDNSAAIGTFIPLEQAGGDLQQLNFHLDIDGKEVQRGNTSDMLFKVDDIIAYVSRFMTLKIGDLLFTGTPAGVGPVSIGQHLQGYLGEEKLLDFYIR